ncbi:MAG: hypothetical protein B7Z81_05500 [Acidocella sp. 20-61-6]|nr:MAG: hypothetical protein B7Z81_05500 [Acidocella sp. 20-61-6]
MKIASWLLALALAAPASAQTVSVQSGIAPSQRPAMPQATAPLILQPPSPPQMLPPQVPRSLPPGETGAGGVPNGLPPGGRASRGQGSAAGGSQA